MTQLERQRIYDHMLEMTTGNAHDCEHVRRVMCMSDRLAALLSAEDA